MHIKLFTIFTGIRTCGCRVPTSTVHLLKTTGWRLSRHSPTALLVMQIILYTTLYWQIVKSKIMKLLLKSKLQNYYKVEHHVSDRQRHIESMLLL